MEKDFRLASKKFWQTVRRLRKGKQGLAQAVLSRGGELLTQTEDIVGRWKEHFEELLNPANTSSGEEAESEASGEAPPISLAEVAKVVKQLFNGKAPGVDEIRPEMLKHAKGSGRCGAVVADTPIQWGHGGIVRSTVASQQEGHGFKSRIVQHVGACSRAVLCGVCMFSPCSPGFPP